MPEPIDMAAVEKAVYGCVDYFDRKALIELIRSIIAERDRLQATCDNWEGIAKKLNSEAEEASVENLRLKAENERLKAALRPYLEHCWECAGKGWVYESSGPSEAIAYVQIDCPSCCEIRAALASAPEPSTGSKEQ